MAKSSYEDAEQELLKYFARAGKMDRRIMNADEQFVYMARTGIKRVKRRLLGFCGTRTYKPLEQIAKVLYETRVVQTEDEGRLLVPRLVEQNLSDERTFDYAPGKYLTFSKESASPSDSEKYCVQVLLDA